MADPQQPQAPQQAPPQGQAPQQEQKPAMSVSQMAGVIKQADPRLQNVPDDQLMGAVFKRRPDLITKVTQPPAGPGQNMKGVDTNSIKEPIGFGPGFARGLNPLHTPPDDTRKKVGGMATFGEDMFNAREIVQRAAPKSMGGTGDTAGAMGLAAGTGASQIIAEGAMKGVGKGLSLAGRSMETSAGVRSAMNFAKTIRSKLPTGTGVSGQALNKATRYVEPLRAKLDEAYEAFHSAMQGQNFPTSNTAQQIIRKMYGKKGEPMIERLAKDLSDPKTGMPRSGLDYKEADQWRRKILQMAKDKKIEGWHDDLHRLADEIDAGIHQAAKGIGMDKRLDWLRSSYNKLVDIGTGVAATTEAKASTAKKVMGTAIGAGVGAMATGVTKGTSEGMVVGGLVGERAAASTKYSLHSGMKQEAEKMARELGVKLSEEMFSGAKGAMDSVGKFMQGAGRYAVPATRAATVGANQALSKDDKK